MMGGDEILDKLLQLLPDNDNDVSILSVIINTLQAAPVRLQRGLADWNTYGHLKMENYVKLINYQPAVITETL